MDRDKRSARWYLERIGAIFALAALLAFTLNVTGKDDATNTETALWTFILFAVGIGVSFYFGKKSTAEAARDIVRPQVGERVEVHVMDAGETPHLVATFGGRLQAGYSMTRGEPSDTEVSSSALTRARRRRRSALTARSSRTGSLMRTEQSRSSWAVWSS